MAITIKALDAEQIGEVDRVDNVFTIDSKVVVQVGEGEITYTFVEAAVRKKRYPIEAFDPAAYVNSPERVIFLADVDGQPGGQIRLSRHWNQFGYVEDIVVAPQFRRLGVGRALLTRGFGWARERGFPGVMLETQDNNVAACRLYESCGMILGGFDRYLYRGIDPRNQECALFWYKIFMEENFDVAGQYRQPQNLQARIYLHQRFSVNTYGWQRWVFDQFKLPDRCRILELGCGPGNLWLENLERIPAGWEITLADFSEGMLAQAEENLAGKGKFRFERIEAGVDPLPFETGALDAVIANHMIYHVQDIAALFAEIQRGLKAGGRLFATTVGERHLGEIDELVHRFDAQQPNRRGVTASFTLENGAEQLQQWFSRVDIIRYEDALEVTEAEPLAAFILSGWVDFTAEQEQALKEFIEAEVAAHGGRLQITKDSGMFVAERAAD